MAEKRTINIDINNNAEEAAKDFQDFAKATKVANDSVEGLNKTFEEVYGELQPLTTRMGEAEDRLYELALAGDTTSKEYQELLTKVGQYRKVQIQTDLAVDAAATTLGQKLGGALTGATGGFAAIQGVMGLVGGESEQLEKALLKVQSALAIQQGVQGIREAIPAFKQLFNTIKVGIGSTGIGLLVVALGALVANFDKIKAAISGVTDEQKALNAESQKNVETQKQNLETLNGQENVLKLQGKSEREILQMKIKQTDAVIETIKANIENDKITTKAQVEQLERSQQMAETIARVTLQIGTLLLRIFTKPLDLLLDGVSEVSKFLGFGELTTFRLTDTLDNLIDKGAEAVSTFLFDPEEAQAESDAAIAEQEKTLQTLENNRAGFLLSIQAMDKAAANKSVETEKKRLEDIDKLREEANAKRIEKEDAQFQLELDLMKDRQLAEIIALTQQYDEKFLLAEGNAELTKQLEEQQEKDIAAIEDRFRKEKEAKDKAASDKEIADAKAVADAKQSIQDAQLNNASAAIGLLKDLAGENNKIQALAIAAENAVGIAKIVISTQAANAAAKLKYAAIPGGLALAAAEITANKISAGIGIAASVAAAAKGIASLKSSAPLDSGGDLGGGGAGSEPQAPQFNVVGDSGVNQLAQLQQQPTQAFVVSGEVTTAQALDRNRVQNATL